MKCPYQKKDDGTFTECTAECPACQYETEEYETTEGRKLPYESVERAIKEGSMWRVKHKRYIIKGCNFVDNLVKPTDSSVTKVTNINKSNSDVTIVKRSIF